MSTTPSTVRKRIAGIVLVGSIAGAGVLAASVAANAADSTPTPAATSSTADADPGKPAAGGAVDESKSGRSDEHLLTGTDAINATATALAKCPGATIQRAETDGDGAYQAQLITAAGQRLIVQLDASFTVMGTDTARATAPTARATARAAPTPRTRPPQPPPADNRSPNPHRAPASTTGAGARSRLPGAEHAREPPTGRDVGRPRGVRFVLPVWLARPQHPDAASCLGDDVARHDDAALGQVVRH